MSRPWSIVIAVLPLLAACFDITSVGDRPIPQTSTDLKPSAAQPQAIAGQSATIISTGDGDTLRVQRDGETVTVRLACIDAPETAQQPYGRQSAEHLPLAPMSPCVWSIPTAMAAPLQRSTRPMNRSIYR